MYLNVQTSIDLQSGKTQHVEMIKSSSDVETNVFGKQRLSRTDIDYFVKLTPKVDVQITKTNIMQ